MSPNTGPYGAIALGSHPGNSTMPPHGIRYPLIMDFSHLLSRRTARRKGRYDNLKRDVSTSLCRSIWKHIYGHGITTRMNRA